MKDRKCIENIPVSFYEIIHNHNNMMARKKKNILKKHRHFLIRTGNITAKWSEPEYLSS